MSIVLASAGPVKGALRSAGAPTSALRHQRRRASAWVGKAGSDTHWLYTMRRDSRAEYWGTKAVEEDRYWDTRGLSRTMYKTLMKYRWQEAAQHPRMPKSQWVFRVGDVVEVARGRDKGLRGTVLDEHHAGMSLKVEGVRLKKNEGQDPATGQSVVQYTEEWLGYDEVKLIDSRLDAAVDVEFMELEDPISGEVTRSRVSRATGTVIPYPETKESKEDSGDDAGDGKKDTPLDVAQTNTLPDGAISKEVNKMALVKLKVIEDWFIGELEGLYAKDKILRDNLATEKREFQHFTYQLALQKVYDRVQEEEPWLLDEVSQLRSACRPPVGRMADFQGDQELYRELRRGSRFKMRHEMRPSDVESLAERHTRTTVRGTKVALHKEIRLRYENNAAMSIKARTTAKAKAEFKIAATFKMRPAEYIQDALEQESAMRESHEIGQAEQYQIENYVGWKPQAERARDELDSWDNRFAHMPSVMEELQQLHGENGGVEEDAGGDVAPVGHVDDAGSDPVDDDDSGPRH